MTIPINLLPLNRTDTSEFFHEHVKIMSTWKRKMIQNTYTHYPACLLTTIQQRSPILIGTYISKSETKSGGVRVLSTPHVNLLAKGSNPDYDSMEKINSHRSEAYAMLSALLFLAKYSNFYNLSLYNKFKIYCDNKEIITNISNIKQYSNYYDLIYQMSEYETIMAIKSYLKNTTKYFTSIVTRT